MGKKEILNQINNAFLSVPVPTSVVSISENFPPEVKKACIFISKILNGRSRETLSDEDVGAVFFSTHIFLIKAEAIIYYFPRFLGKIICGSTSKERGFILEYLADWRTADHLSSLDRNQIKALQSFLEFIRQSNLEIESDRPNMLYAAIAVWHK